MLVRIFSAITRPGTPDADAFELEINNWLTENEDIEILSMTVSSSERDGDISMVFFVVYEELEDDESDDELSVTLPQLKVEIPFSPLRLDCDRKHTAKGTVLTLVAACVP